jgi:membrane protein
MIDRDGFGRMPLWARAIGAVLLLSGLPKRGQPAPAPRHPDTAAGTPRETDSDARGRAATSPTEIPAPGWRDIVLRVYRGVAEDRIVAISGGVTFFILLAIFPAVAGLISLYGLFADPTRRQIDCRRDHRWRAQS